MAFLGLCADDDLLSTIRNVFGANPIRVPEERIQPMIVLASSGSKTSFRGTLAPLLRGTPNLAIDILPSGMSNLAGKRSKSVSIDLGLKILEGFLSGIGIPTAGVVAKFSGASEVSFSFQDVRRLYVDPGVVGNLLTGQVINDKNPAASIFFDKQYQFLVIDSTIQSRDFNIKVEKKSGNSFSLDVPAIQDIVGQAKAGVTVSSSSSLDLTFKGEKFLSFAFSCLRLYVDGNGRVASMPPAGDVPGLAAIFGEERKDRQSQPLYTPDRVLISRDPGLLDVADHTM